MGGGNGTYTFSVGAGLIGVPSGRGGSQGSSAVEDGWRGSSDAKEGGMTEDHLDYD